MRHPPHRPSAGSPPRSGKGAEPARPAGPGVDFRNLNAQAAGGWIVYHPESRSYELTAEQAYILADETSPVHMMPAWNLVASFWADEEKAIRAFRTGEGVAWGDHDGRLYCGIVTGR